MRKWSQAFLIFGIAAVLLGIYWKGLPGDSSSKSPVQLRLSSPRVSVSQPASQHALPAPESVNSRVEAALEERKESLSHLKPLSSPPVAPTFESTNLAPTTILENMRTVIRQYGSTFGGNPVGTNPEITKSLLGENPKQLNFLKPDGNRVNANGELVDPWGTPYFFHQLSGKDMEIRSAGPDRIMYTTDDLVIK